MDGEKFDCVVVGARCAGAPLATLLAREGLRVVMLDAAKMPSDQPISTHFIQPIGVDWLEELGVGEALRAMSPPIYRMRFQMFDAPVEMSFQRGRAAYCPRREPFDRALQEAAVAAGVDFRDQSNVTGLIFDGDRVVGVEVASGGNKERIRAPVVVGADGRNSTVSQLVGAKEYLGIDACRFAYWAYWPMTDEWCRKSFGSYIHLGKDWVNRFIFETGDDQVIMGVVPRLSELSRYKADVDKTVRRALAENDMCASLVDGSAPATKWVGILKLRFFFREAAGRGWALVGDAGLHKDPTPGLGMTDALRDARNLAKAIVAGGDRALERYWRQRDVDSLELFAFANQMGSERFASAFQETIFAHANQSEALKTRMARQADREISPYEVFGLDVVLPCLAKTVLRGNFDAVREFFRMGKQGAEVKQHLAERQALLARVSA